MSCTSVPNRLFVIYEKLSSFYFPFKNDELNQKWIPFVNKSDWVPSKNSVLCELYFEDKYKNRGKRMSVNWSVNPVPTIHFAGRLLGKGFFRMIN